MADLNVRLGVPYTQAATENGPMTLALDFYAPKGACTAPRPTMVMIHGGGFKTGDRNSRRWKEFAVSFGKQGWNSISLSYRLVKDEPVIHPVLMQSIPMGCGAKTGIRPSLAPGRSKPRCRQFSLSINAPDRPASTPTTCS